MNAKIKEAKCRFLTRHFQKTLSEKKNFLFLEKKKNLKNF